MPELPEVEILTRQLSQIIINKKIISITNSSKKLRKPIPNLEHLIGKHILKIERNNKYIIIFFKDSYLVFHLGMTGKLLITKTRQTQNHRHLTIQLDNDLFLNYDDIRRFGLIQLFYNNVRKTDNVLFNKLGIEPLSNQYNKNSLDNLLTEHNINIKKFLMNNEYICGIGNIYANEILFHSHISPLKRTHELTIEQKNLLYYYIPKVLKYAIKLGGSSISDYVHLDGSRGQMQNHYFVYSRYNQPCNVCNNLIKKIKQQARSTYYCPNCQK